MLTSASGVCSISEVPLVTVVALRCVDRKLPFVVVSVAVSALATWRSLSLQVLRPEIRLVAVEMLRMRGVSGWLAVACA